jgi:hypothetical protein
MTHLASFLLFAFMAHLNASTRAFMLNVEVVMYATGEDLMKLSGQLQVRLHRSLTTFIGGE